LGEWIADVDLSIMNNAAMPTIKHPELHIRDAYLNNLLTSKF